MPDRAAIVTKLRDAGFSGNILDIALVAWDGRTEINTIEFGPLRIDLHRGGITLSHERVIVKAARSNLVTAERTA